MPTVIIESAGGYTGISGGSEPAPFAVVRLPFPFTDRLAMKNRPALVLSDAARFNVPADHSVLAMISSAGNPPGHSAARSVTARVRVCPHPRRCAGSFSRSTIAWCGARSGISRSPMSGGCGRR